MTTYQLYLSPQFMRLFALAVIKEIRKRTLEGIDKDGKPFAPYSEKPFAMPSGALKSKERRELEKRERLSFFKTKSGSSWVVVLGGYKELKATRRPQHGGTVNLTDTGKTLRALIANKFFRNQVTLGFSTDQEAEKAYWHVTGTAKGGKVRDFMGLPVKVLEDILYSLVNNPANAQYIELV